MRSWVEMDKSRSTTAVAFGAVALVVVLLGFGILLAAAAFWGFTGHGGMMGGGCPWCGGLGAIGGGSIVGILVLLVVALAGLGFLGLLILAVMWLIRRSSNG
jgi:hypothetical protein